jgi:uncharacterized repeat protein (TIGR02543 family)
MIAFLILLTATIAIMACDSSSLSVDSFNEDTPDTYTVYFNSQFSNTESTTVMPNPTSITIESSKTTVDALPTEPSMSGYTFGGWWTLQNGYGIQFTTSTNFSTDLVVYAYWIPSYKYTVTFNSDSTTAYSTKDVLPPFTTVRSLPDPPTADGSIFAGWYTGTEGTGTEFTADTLVAADTTVYAKWSTDPLCTVIYDGNGGSAVPAQYITCEDTVTLPTEAPTKECSSFAGWYTADDTEFTSDTTVTQDITVHAKWTWSYTPSSPPFAIGDPGPSCVGKVFYITNDGYSGLEAAPADWYAEAGDPSSVWIAGDSYVDEDTSETIHKTQSTLNGNTSTAIGTGLANTEAIIAQVNGVGGTETLYAAKLCRDYDGGGLNDWFLPSKDELAQLYAQRDVQKSGGFADASYWSSSEYSARDAYTQNFEDGTQKESYKSFERKPRPVRAFSF